MVKYNCSETSRQAISSIWKTCMDALAYPFLRGWGCSALELLYTSAPDKYSAFISDCKNAHDWGKKDMFSWTLGKQCPAYNAAQLGASKPECDNMLGLEEDIRKNFNGYLDYILDNFKSSMNAHKFPHCSDIAQLMDLINY